MTKLKPCKYCKCSKAETFCSIDLWYVRCRGGKKGKHGEFVPCKKWGTYEFLGLTEEAAIQNWNNRNVPINQGEEK